MGFFSLQLGILNLLPIPVLDGGHIMILGVEGVIRRELSDRLKERVMQVGFVFLLAFMSVVIYRPRHPQALKRDSVARNLSACGHGHRFRPPADTTPTSPSISFPR